LEEEKNQANYREKEAKRVEKRRQAINNLPHLTRRELNEKKAAIDAQIAATNEERRREFEELDEEMLSVGLGRGSDDTPKAVSKSSRQVNKPPRKIASEVALLARSMIEMNKTLHAVVMNQQASKKLNLKNKRQKHVQQRTKDESHVIDERLNSEDRKSGDTHQCYGDVDAFEKRYNKKRDGMVKIGSMGKNAALQRKKSGRMSPRQQWNHLGILCIPSKHEVGPSSWIMMT
jgi:hypothetical protein